MKPSTNSEYLREEYKQLHESLHKSNDGIVSAIRFPITLLAASIGAVVIALLRQPPSDRHTVLYMIIGIGAFFYIASILGSFLLVGSFRSVRRMLMAINAIRDYFAIVDKIPPKYVIMPLPKNKEQLPLFGGWPAIYFAHMIACISLGAIVAAAFFLFDDKSIYRSIYLRLWVVPILLAILHAYLIQMTLKRAERSWGYSGGGENNSDCNSDTEPGPIIPEEK